MADRLLALRGAGELTRAAPDHRAFLAHDLRAADRTGIRHPPLWRIRATLVWQYPHDFRDHVTGAAHHHGIADAHVQPCDLVGVVQGRAGHGADADGRSKARRGGEEWITT